jgi:hypothetical protein
MRLVGLSLDVCRGSTAVTGQDLDATGHVLPVRDGFGPAGGTSEQRETKPVDNTFLIDESVSLAAENVSPTAELQNSLDAVTSSGSPVGPNFKFRSDVAGDFPTELCGSK